MAPLKQVPWCRAQPEHPAGQPQWALKLGLTQQVPRLFLPSSYPRAPSHINHAHTCTTHPHAHCMSVCRSSAYHARTRPPPNIHRHVLTTYCVQRLVEDLERSHELAAGQGLWVLRVGIRANCLPPRKLVLGDPPLQARLGPERPPLGSYSGLLPGSPSHPHQWL